MSQKILIKWYMIGLLPISTMVFGFVCVSSDNLVPNPPQRITTGISLFIDNFQVTYFKS